MTQAELLTGQKERGKPVTLAGALRLPKTGEKLPAVVLMHGAGGIGASNNYVETWASVLNTAGFATFTVDSFTGRGVYSFADVGKVPAIARINDAYRALQAIAKHPGVDPIKGCPYGLFARQPSCSLWKY